MRFSSLGFHGFIGGMIPALAMAETDWQLGELNEGKHKFIMESLKEMIQDRGDRQPDMHAKKDTANANVGAGDSVRVDATNSAPLSILCLPARSAADEIAALMLAQVLEATGCIVQTVSLDSLAYEMVELVNQCTAEVVCISATPPAAVMHARYLCKRLRSRLPDVKLVVGLWDAEGDLSKAIERISYGAIVVPTLSDAHDRVCLLMQSRLPLPKKSTPLDSGPEIMADAHL